MRRSFASIVTAITALSLTASLAWASSPQPAVTVKPAPGSTVVVIPPAPPAQPAPEAPFPGIRPAVDVAILLDTSNSMDGLIDQAKRQLWAIVDQFAKAQKDGKTPSLRVALFEYGNNGLPAAEGYIRQVVPLTTDLDKLSEGLFALKTNGGDEYCGQVIQQALARLDWTNEPGAYKAIFIAGNEPFTQGEVDYKDACAAAIQAGVVVNTIHCGDRSAGKAGSWGHGAELAEGESFNIDQDRAVVEIPTPMDEIIIQLNAELNQTYLWIGDRRQREFFRSNQAAQDDNAAKLSRSVLASRANAKSSRGYSNVGRDIVDTLRERPEALGDLEADHLPEELKNLSEAEVKAKVKELREARETLQAKIKEINAKREKFLAQEKARLAAEAGEPKDTLGDAVLQAIRGQLQARGYTIAPTP